MASLNQVSIELQVTGERQATQSLKRYSDASDKLTRSVLNAAGKIENTTNAWDRANKLFEKGILNSKGLQAAQTQLARELAVVNGYVKTNGALNTQKALAELKAVQATKAAAAAEAQANAERQRAQQSYNQLRATIDQSYAARMRLKQAADTLRAAERQGLITREQAIEQLRQYRALQTSTSVSVNNFGNANHHASRRMNGMGMAVQQTGYQVGDFLVQVQGGTNWMVAFGQQATQLVGILPMMGAQLGLSVTKLIGISTVLGIGIPLLTAFGAAIMRTREGADETLPPLEALTQAVDDYSRSAEEATQSSKDLGEMYGDSADKARELFEVNKTLSELDAIDALKRSMVSLRDTFGDFSSVSTQSLESAMQTFDELGERAITGVGLSDRQFRSAINAVELYRSTVSNLEGKLGSTREEAFQFAIELSKLSQADGPQQAANQLDVVRSLYFDIIGGAEGATDAQRDMLRELVNTAIEALNLKVEIEKAEDATKNTADAARDIGPALQGAIDQANAFANAIDRAASRAAGIGISTSGIRAERKALESGRGEAEAAALGAATSARERILSTVDRPGPQRDELAQREFDRIFSAELERRKEQQRLESVQESLRPDSGGAATSSTTKTQEDYLAKLQSEAELKLRLIGLTEEQQRYQEIVNELKDRELLVGGELSDQQEARIQQIIKMEEETRNLMERQKERENLERKVQQTIESGLMSLLDGSASVEDAFKTMIRAILKEIAMKAIVEPIASGITGMFFEKGGAFNNGNVIPFANGGVVSSPTMFPMAGSQTGLMGEAGPEAIMPLKRGKGGKLGVAAEGGQQPVVINQSFNFSANGDESVKRIIAQEAPRIANLTQKQIIDQRRRGGNLKAAFG